MRNAPDDELLKAAKSALDALEYLSHGVHFEAKQRLRDAIRDAEVSAAQYDPGLHGQIKQRVPHA